MKAQSLGSPWAGMSVAVPCSIAIISGPSSSADPPNALSDGPLYPSPAAHSSRHRISSRKTAYVSPPWRSWLSITWRISPFAGDPP
ncbi:hypothetical protein LX36DRAFT_284847 [Colletotrichum falcatum]|nr:hypothetical protein LX36DRAFT_284847 [Colletotrichum falcatum]